MCGLGAEGIVWIGVQCRILGADDGLGEEAAGTPGAPGAPTGTSFGAAAAFERPCSWGSGLFGMGVSSATASGP